MSETPELSITKVAPTFSSDSTAARVPASLSPLLVWGVPFDTETDEPFDYASRAPAFVDLTDDLLAYLLAEVQWMASQEEEDEDDPESFEEDEDDDEDEEESEEEDGQVWAPYHALLLLRELAPPEAAAPLLSLFQSRNEYLIEAMPDLYAAIGAPGLPVLHAFVADPDKDTDDRGYTLRIIGAVAESNDDLRDQISDWLIAYLRRPERDSSANDEFLNGSAIAALCDLHGNEAKESGVDASTHPAYVVAKEAIEAGIVDDHQISLDDVKIDFGLRELWTDEEREQLAQTPRISLLCDSCERARFYTVSAIYYDPNFGDPEDPFSGEARAGQPHSPLYIPDTIKCPRCDTVDQYSLSPMGKSAVGMAMMMEAMNQKGEHDFPRTIQFIEFDKLGFGGHPRQVEQEFRRRLAESPTDPEFYMEYGKFLMFCRRNDLALHQFYQVLKLDAEHPEALFYLARLAEQNDHIEEALVFWEKAKAAAENARRLPRRLKKMIVDSASTRLALAQSDTMPKRMDGEKLKPNAPCFCGSGKKYKKCCMR